MVINYEYIVTIQGEFIDSEVIQEALETYFDNPDHDFDVTQVYVEYNQEFEEGD